MSILCAFDKISTKIARALPCLKAIQKWQDTYNASLDVIPLSFWRDTKYLLVSTGRQRRTVQDGPAMSPMAQCVFVERMLHELLLRKAGVCQIRLLNCVNSGKGIVNIVNLFVIEVHFFCIFFAVCVGSQLKTGQSLWPVPVYHL